MHVPSELFQLACGWCLQCSKCKCCRLCNANCDKTDILTQWACCLSGLPGHGKLGSYLGCCHWRPLKALNFLHTQMGCLIFVCVNKLFTFTAYQANSPFKFRSASVLALFFPPAFPLISVGDDVEYLEWKMTKLVLRITGKLPGKSHSCNYFFSAIHWTSWRGSHWGRINIKPQEATSAMSFFRAKSLVNANSF